MIEAVYISSNGKKFNLIGDKMRITNGRVHKYSWKKVVIAGKYGDILDGFTKEACAYRLTQSILLFLSATHEVAATLHQGVPNVPSHAKE